MPALAHRFELAEEDVALPGGPLRLLRPRSADDLLEAAVASGADNAPYWAALWPAARTLATWVADQPLAGRRVLELGCGLALPGLVAARAGADVLASDRDPDALAFAAENGRRLTGRPLPTLLADFGEDGDGLVAHGPFDLVLAADVLYQRSNADALASLLPRLLAPGGRAVVAFPWAGQSDVLAVALEAAGLGVSTTGTQPWLLHAVRPAA